MKQTLDDMKDKREKGDTQLYVRGNSTPATPALHSPLHKAFHHKTENNNK